MKRKYVRALVAVFVTCVVTAGAFSVPNSTATASGNVSAKKGAAAGWYPTPGAMFNVPRSRDKYQAKLERQVIASINHARPGSIIKMAMFSFDRMPVADALIAARRRGVKIQVIVNDHEWPAAQRKLRKVLGSVRKHNNWFRHCKSSCRGQGDVQHSKFILFSATGAATNVVMVGSLNMKLNGVKNQFNDLLTLNNNPKLYSALNTVFDQMKLDKPAKPQYLDLQIDPRTELFVLPFPKKGLATKQTEWTPARDPISRLLAPIICTGAQTPNGRTVVRVNMHAWDGARGEMLARKFVDLFRKGCDVRLQVGFASKPVRKIFATRTARGQIPARSTGYDTDGDDLIDLYSHQKVLLVHGRYGTAKNQSMIVTGSSNYQNGGQYGDEIILKIFSGSYYKQYINNWNWSWKYHTHGFAGLAGSVAERVAPSARE